MHQFLVDAARVAIAGIGATALMDVWLLLLKRMNLPTLNLALLGRWVGHMWRGKWAHEAIAKASPIKNEVALGWFAHYAIGIAFATALACLLGPQWTRSPNLLAALCLGIGTVVAPLFIMQPAMGAGVASSRTPTPVRNCLRSLANHTVFGAGLYLSAIGINWIAR